ncbi:hypothetical protein, partial [Shewanella xiamenensis]
VVVVVLLLWMFLASMFHKYLSRGEIEEEINTLIFSAICFFHSGQTERQNRLKFCTLALKYAKYNCSIEIT